MFCAEYGEEGPSQQDHKELRGFSNDLLDWGDEHGYTEKSVDDLKLRMRAWASKHGNGGSRRRSRARACHIMLGACCVFTGCFRTPYAGRGWREIFKDYDYDGSGQMDLQEFRHASAPLC